MGLSIEDFDLHTTTRRRCEIGKLLLSNLGKISMRNIQWTGKCNG